MCGTKTSTVKGSDWIHQPNRWTPKRKSKRTARMNERVTKTIKDTRGSTVYFLLSSSSQLCSFRQFLVTLPEASQRQYWQFRATTDPGAHSCGSGFEAALEIKYADTSMESRKKVRIISIRAYRVIDGRVPPADSIYPIGVTLKCN